MKKSTFSPLAIIAFTVLFLVGCTADLQTSPETDTQEKDQRPVAQAPSDQKPPVMCTMEYRYGLTLNLKDAEGKAINDAKITILESKSSPDMASDFTQFENTGTYVGLGEGRGAYRLKIEKPGYESQEFAVTLEHDQCHVQPQTLELTLQTSKIGSSQTKS